MDKRLFDLPEIIERESTFSLDDIINKISSYSVTNAATTTSDLEEAILCLANEIKRIKKILEAHGIND